MIIWVHLVTALLALGLGIANLGLTKGTSRHRSTGWLWIVTMLFVTLSSFGIRELNDGKFSWIHGLSVWTLFSLFAAVYSIRRSWIRVHAGFMVGTMVGVLVAGAFALVPGRFISTVLGY